MCSALERDQEALNRLNVFPVPDRDTGTNLLETIRAAAATAEGAADQELAGAVTRAALRAARGASGVIMSQVVAALSSALSDGTGEGLAGALTRAAEAAREAVAEPVEGTILTVARAAADRARAVSAAGRGPLEVLEEARSAAAEALARTPDQLSELAEAGVVDAGGAAYLLLLDSLLSAWDGREVPPVPVPQGPPPERPTETPRFEVLARLTLHPGRVEEARRRWSTLPGEAAVLVAGAGEAVAHIHTDSPDLAETVARDLGRVVELTVTDLVEQMEKGRG
jgi:dihydroxyacetone kinase-like predicted kinase